MDTLMLIVTFAPLVLRVGWAVWSRRRVRRSST
jgi:hypothetical protein